MVQETLWAFGMQWYLLFIAFTYALAQQEFDFPRIKICDIVIMQGLLNSFALVLHCYLRFEFVRPPDDTIGYKAALTWIHAKTRHPFDEGIAIGKRGIGSNKIRWSWIKKTVATEAAPLLRFTYHSKRTGSFEFEYSKPVGNYKLLPANNGFKTLLLIVIYLQSTNWRFSTPRCKYSHIQSYQIWYLWEMALHRLCVHSELTNLM